MANLSKMDVVIKDGYANITANMKLLNSVICNFHSQNIAHANFKLIQSYGCT